MDNDTFTTMTHGDVGDPDTNGRSESEGWSEEEEQMVPKRWKSFLVKGREGKREEKDKKEKGEEKEKEAVDMEDNFVNETVNTCEELIYSPSESKSDNSEDRLEEKKEEEEEITQNTEEEKTDIPDASKEVVESEELKEDSESSTYVNIDNQREDNIDDITNTNTELDENQSNENVDKEEQITCQVCYDDFRKSETYLFDNISKCKSPLKSLGTNFLVNINTASIVGTLTSPQRFQMGSQELLSLLVLIRSARMNVIHSS